MSAKYPKAAAHFDPAMTFEEIGRALGIPKQAAYFLFVSGLNKLRRKPRELKLLQELVDLRSSLRGSRPLPDNDLEVP